MVETQGPQTCLVWVFTGDSGRNDVASGDGRVGRGLKRNGRHPPWGLSIQKPDILQPVQRHAHGDLKSRNPSQKRVSAQTRRPVLEAMEVEGGGE